MKIYVKQ